MSSGRPDGGRPRAPRSDRPVSAPAYGRPGPPGTPVRDATSPLIAASAAANVFVVDGQVGGVAGRLPAPQAAAELPQVEGIEVQPVRADVLRKFCLQEVVRPAMQVEDRSRGVRIRCVSALPIPATPGSGTCSCAGRTGRPAAPGGAAGTYRTSVAHTAPSSSSASGSSTLLEPVTELVRPPLRRVRHGPVHSVPPSSGMYPRIQRLSRA